MATNFEDIPEKGICGAMEERYSALTDWSKLKSCLLSPARKAIRVNTLKATAAEVKKQLSKEWALEQVPWCREGFWIKPKEEIKSLSMGSLPQHTSGHFFIQEAASMVPAMVLGPEPGERVLDMCASPGGKTTQLAALMNNSGEIVANDIRPDRIAILKRNIARLGVTNCKVTMMPGQQFKDIKFDRVLVDAPCSATGNMRGNLEGMSKWSPEIFRRLAFEQRSLLHHAYCVLKRGGLLVYSTCSLEPEENEAVVDWLLKRHKKTEMEEITIKGINRSRPIAGFGGTAYDVRVSRCLRLWPQDNDTNGFFVAKLRKL